MITHFSQDAPPLSVVLLLDCAEQGPASGLDSDLEWVRQGALEALRMLRPEDEIGLMAFGQHAEILQDFTNDRQVLSDKIRSVHDNVSIRVGLSWDINEAIYQAAAHLSSASNPYARRLSIAVTWNGACQEVSKGHTKQEATHELFESGTAVCGLHTWDDIALNRAPSTRLINAIMSPIALVGRTVQRSNPYLFRDPIGYYARETGGRVAIAANHPGWPSPRSARELADDKAEFARFVDRMRECYTLGYVSSNTKRDGTFRKIELKVSADLQKRKGRMDVIARKGYYARRFDRTVSSPADKASPSPHPSLVTNFCRASILIRVQMHLSEPPWFYSSVGRLSRWRKLSETLGSDSGLIPILAPEDEGIPNAASASLSSPSKLGAKQVSSCI